MSTHFLDHFPGEFNEEWQQYLQHSNLIVLNWYSFANKIFLCISSQNTMNSAFTHNDFHITSA